MDWSQTIGYQIIKAMFSLHLSLSVSNLLSAPFSNLSRFLDIGNILSIYQPLTNVILSMNLLRVNCPIIEIINKDIKQHFPQ